MIIGLGTDLVALPRFDQFLARYAQRARLRLFTPLEWDYAMAHRNPSRRTAALALRFAAKEACAKALATGIGRDAHFSEIGVVNAPSGQPTLTLTGNAQRTLQMLIPQGMSEKMWVSLSDDGDYAYATVVLEVVNYARSLVKG